MSALKRQDTAKRYICFLLTGILLALVEATCFAAERPGNENRNPRTHGLNRNR